LPKAPQYKINKEEDEAIFDKFYQSRNQNIKKPVGSGLD
jgi:K+-sensing histidine kinase KdpD